MHLQPPNRIALIMCNQVIQTPKVEIQYIFSFFYGSAILFSFAADNLINLVITAIKYTLMFRAGAVDS